MYDSCFGFLQKINSNHVKKNPTFEMSSQQTSNQRRALAPFPPCSHCTIAAARSAVAFENQHLLFCRFEMPLRHGSSHRRKAFCCCGFWLWCLISCGRNCVCGEKKNEFFNWWHWTWFYDVLNNNLNYVNNCERKNWW